jgi:uncharacterized protein
VEETTQVQEQKASPTLTIKEFQEEVHEGKLEGYKCKKCGHKQIDIMVFCPRCRSPELSKMEFSTEGTVVTYTIQQVAPEAFLNEVPYAWAIVQLDNGPKITGWIPFIAKPSDLPVGQRVRFKKSYLPGIVFEKILPQN